MWALIDVLWYYELLLMIYIYIYYACHFISFLVYLLWIFTKYIDIWYYVNIGYTNTLQGTNISPKNGILKMIFLFPRWDMLIPWRVCFTIQRDIPGFHPRMPDNEKFMKDSWRMSWKKCDHLVGDWHPSESRYISNYIFNCWTPGL